MQKAAESPAVAGLKPMLMTGRLAVPRLPGSKTWPQTNSHQSQGIKGLPDVWSAHEANASMT